MYRFLEITGSGCLQFPLLKGGQGVVKEGRTHRFAPTLLLLCLTVSLLLCGTVALAATVQLPQTGQTKCYNTSGTEVTCTGTGQDADWNTGVGLPNPRFTAGTGAQVDCVTDNLTGLMWMKVPDYITRRSWQGAIDYAKELSLCGFTDWRVPTIVELESTVNSELSNPATGVSGVASYFYWSSTTGGSSKNQAWSVNMTNGYVFYSSKTESYYVWSVRGGQPAASADIWETGQKTCYNTSGTVITCTGTEQDGDLQPGVAWPNPRFSNNGNGTVTDNLTGLIWLKNANCFGERNWDQALSSANNLVSGTCGLSDGSQTGDWRLPNRKELFSLLDFEYSSPALSNSSGTGKWTAGVLFDGVQSSYYWSSTTYAPNTTYAWRVSLSSGYVNWNDTKGYNHYVWPVRGELSGSPCAYSISPTSQTFTSSGGTGSVTVTTESSCDWTATEGLDWVTITSGSSGTGNGTVSYSVSSNSTGAARTGNMTIAGQTFAITQNDMVFSDVPSNYWAYDYINAIFNAGITSGCGNGNYCPESPVTRAQMAVFVVRALEQQPAATCTGTIFNDVNANMNGGEGFCRYIEKFRELNITAGCAVDNPNTPQNDAAYCPDNNVTRSQMAVFLTKALGQQPAVTCTGTVFNDVNAGMNGGDAFCKYIEKFRELNITAGCVANNPNTLDNEAAYCPDNSVTRAQMAVFLTKGFLQ